MIIRLPDDIKAEKITISTFWNLPIIKKFVIYCNDCLIQPLLRQDLDLKELQFLNKKNFEQIHLELKQ